MAGSRQLECLAEELSCSICLSLFVQPVSLPCEHSFCRPCISQCWEAQGELGPPGGPSCPHCRLPCPGKALKPNRVLANLVEQLRCLELALGDSPLCLEHQEALKLFCEDDQELICLICRDDPKHSQHSFLPLRQAASKYKHQLNEILSTEEGKQQKRSILIEQQQEQISALQETSGTLLHHISSEFEELHRFLAGREQHLSEELEQETEQCRRLMEGNLTAAERVRSTAEQGLSQLRAAIAEKNDSAFLKALKGLKQRFQEKGGNEVMNVVKRGPELGIFKGPLQYTVWKEMLQILSPVLASLTLDPRTAQPRLILSEDLTKVHSGNLRRNLPNGRERFEPCTCVLSSQGFTSGKHYWEVEVANKTDWDLGLALETAGRKGQITLMPSVGYWTICQRHGHTYGALAVPSVILKLTAKPRKIGIYLDYEGGQVSFYNADSMSHLYTFTDTFKGKLFPFFNPWINKSMGNSEPLKLLHLKLTS
ncbi:zinc-binding protein A33-like [Scyliorhinus torazame]|uniref:zinc-binding protein A33-like n=1 Tax=Scyliorhinus torazame TaxID=75743 RepID=UPI003B5A88F8